MGACCSVEYPSYVDNHNSQQVKVKDLQYEGIEVPLKEQKLDCNEFLNTLFPHNVLECIGCDDKVVREYMRELTTIETLELLAWLELFDPSGPVKRDYPWLWTKVMKTYFDCRKDMFDKNINMNSDKDMESIFQTIIHFQIITKEEFIDRSIKSIDDFLESIYSTKRDQYSFRSEAKLASTLCEDIFYFVRIQLNTVREHTSASSDLLALVVALIFDQLRLKQISVRDTLLSDLKLTCACANDYLRMSENAEDLLAKVIEECKVHKNVEEQLDDSLSKLLLLYGRDAVFTAQYTSTFVFASIEEATEINLFSIEWEKDLKNKKQIKSIVKTMEDYLEDFEKWLDPFLFGKSVEALVMASSVFYIKCLITKAEFHGSKKKPYFQNPQSAIECIRADIVVLRDFFTAFISRLPKIVKVVNDSIEVLNAVVNCLDDAITSDYKDSFKNRSRYFVVLCDKIGELELTKNLIGDLYHLAAPQREVKVRKLIKDNWIRPNQSIESDHTCYGTNRKGCEGIYLTQMLKKCAHSKRQKISSKAMKKIKKAVKGKKGGFKSGKSADEV